MVCGIQSHLRSCRFQVRRCNVRHLVILCHSGSSELSYAYQVLANIQRAYGGLKDQSSGQEGRPGRIVRFGLRLEWGVYGSFSERTA